MAMWNYVITTHYTKMSDTSSVVLSLNIHDNKFTADTYTGENRPFKVDIKDGALVLEFGYTRGTQRIRQGDCAISKLLSESLYGTAVSGTIAAYVHGVPQAIQRSMTIWLQYLIYEMLYNIDTPGEYEALCAIGVSTVEECVNNMFMYAPDADFKKQRSYVNVLNAIYAELRKPHIYKYLSSSHALTMPEVSKKLEHLASEVFSVTNLKQLNNELRMAAKE